MAITKRISNTSVTIEVQNGVDKAGDPTFTKKSFSNVRPDVNVDNLYDVAVLITGIISVATRDIFINETSELATY